MFKSQLNIPSSSPSPVIFSSTVSGRLLRQPPPKLVQPAAAKLKGSRRDAARRGIRCSLQDRAQTSTAVVGTVRSLTAVVTVKVTMGGLLSNLGISRGLDDIADLLGKTLLLELASAELDPNSGEEKEPVAAYAHRDEQDLNEIKYKASFEVPKIFGEIGAIFVTNEHHKEMYLDEITLEEHETKTIITCRSWVHAKSDNPEKRIFFTNKSYLPAKTPGGLLRLRSKELELLRGNGQGERKASDRIYDYDTYNDLGDPDNGEDKARPVLGGSKKYPYPRRCRTGRPKSKKDPQSEARSGSVYVPRDEAFSEVKSDTFSIKTLRSVLHAIIPSIRTAIVDTKLGFPNFQAIDSLFDDGFKISNQKGFGNLRTIVPRLLKAVTEGAEELLLFEMPDLLERDYFSWFKDGEFCRQTLAGVNPYAIELVKELPLVSKLDPDIYGPPESAITPEIIEEAIKGVMTAKQALQQKRLFMLDYHDLFLPYVNKVRELEDTTLYASRTIFFLNNDCTLRPIAIELTRPASPAKPQWKQVFTPRWDGTGAWLWKLAKAHVLAHDSGHHQLISHWLRTHCCVEPYIIAANRQLSVMHPIYRLLHPHFRYTMEINALAREFLINADGIIESSFSPLKYSTEISSVAYSQSWRFDMEALPADLVRRGLAIEDPTAEHGVKLTIEDYPFANDGLLIWSAIKTWVHEYVSHYYPDQSGMINDHELQGWWTEVRTKGHADKKDEPWWPELNTIESLTQTLTTIMWVASGHHAAVNFAQYQFGGYFPNRPTIARINMPVEDWNEEDFAKFMEKPEMTLLRCFPSQIQATIVMAVLDVLSSHAPDEEYLGGQPEKPWEDDRVIHAAYKRFHLRLNEIAEIIDERNSDLKLKNRVGAGVVPYKLMKPFSEPGVTAMGVPNSISI